MVQVTKKKKETALSLLKRFNRKMQQSGNLLRFKKLQFKTRIQSAYKKRKGALGRIQKREKMEKLFKLGKLEYRGKSNAQR